MAQSKEIHIIFVPDGGLDEAIRSGEKQTALCGEKFLVEERPSLDRRICVVCVAIHNRDLTKSTWTVTTFRKF